MKRPIDLDPRYAGKVLPRHDLRVEAFKRYEDVIARACRSKETHLSEIEFPMGRTGRRPNAATFVARFADAKLGYKRYNYQSSTIPPSFDLDNLVAYELDGNQVVIVNHALSAAPLRPLMSSDHATILATLREFPSYTPGSRIPIRLDPSSRAADLAWLSSIEDAHSFLASEPDAYNFVYLSRVLPTEGDLPSVELSPEEMEALGLSPSS